MMLVQKVGLQCGGVPGPGTASYKLTEGTANLSSGPNASIFKTFKGGDFINVA